MVAANSSRLEFVRLGGKLTFTLQEMPKKKEINSIRLSVYVISSIIFAVANSITFKQQLTKYKSRKGFIAAHDYEVGINFYFAVKNNQIT